MENQQHSEATTANGMGQVMLPDIHNLTTQIVNLQFIGTPGPNSDWVLIDAGMTHSEDRIIEAATERFGANRPPKAILLTHGHFDHVGAIVPLAEKWRDVPIYAHRLELPYLTGRAAYPPPDPTVGGGLVARLSVLFPDDPIDLRDRVQALPDDGTISELPGWKWIHTPGHTPGHVSLFREEDRVLIAGDAFITVKQESLLAVLTQEQELHGPPAYFTPDWQAAWESVKILAALKPSVAYTGHGRPMSGDLLTNGLDNLARDFDQIAIPKHGRYVH
ncbi:MBL fold metallo-hydrolase [Tumebacillus permanentifrigoris]|uniref:Glyoxylase-like metal-dependent hydrolase (Beta-lactamase superfamily II) n=1 Tax=Tumebacillus permanentifrigoris TaxID=378543 RepID=A0A316DAU3_9BACL|nr:MBL fold metallo-hydrolase [Tumebacillus permanentifrigoris]PWK14848.1 glyoxylase-like metal-dependent hydrolase (beta-lactamase superfamily II) [Tumebacillus permanentifrigoris]